MLKLLPKSLIEALLVEGVPDVHVREFCRHLSDHGCVMVRDEEHMKWVNPANPTRLVPVPRHYKGRPIVNGLTGRSITRDLGICDYDRCTHRNGKKKFRV